MNPWISHLLCAAGGGSTLPSSGLTFYESLKTSLIPEVGTGGPTWSRTTKAWGFNELGYLGELASGCAFFGGARLVVNLCSTKSENFGSGYWNLFSATVSGTSDLTAKAGTATNSIFDIGTVNVKVGEVHIHRFRVQYVDIRYVQLSGHHTPFGVSQFCNFDLVGGTYNATGCTASMTLVSSGVWDISITSTVITASALGGGLLYLVTGLSALRGSSFTASGTEVVKLIRYQQGNVTGYANTYIPEYVSVGVLLNTVRTTSEDFSNAVWIKTGSITTPSANVVVCANATSQQLISQDTGAPAIGPGIAMSFNVRVKYIAGGVSYLQLLAPATAFGTSQWASFSLLDGSVVATGVQVRSVNLGGGTFEFSIRGVSTGAGSEFFSVVLANSISDTRGQSYVGDGVKSFQLLRAWSVNVSQFDASYVPPYYAVGVGTNVYFGAGIDGAKYFETDWQGAPIAAANLLRVRREAAATNNLLWSRDMRATNWIVSITTGSEIITNGGFAIDASWAKETGWTIGTGVATKTAGVAGRVYQATTLVIGKTYTVSYELTRTAGTMTVSAVSGNTQFCLPRTTSGTYTETFTANAVTTSIAFGGDAAFAGTVDNVSVKEAAVQCTQATGLDGIDNTATTLTATAADAIILQPITLASAARCASAYVKRKTGTGTISFTQDGSTWTDITAQINGSTWSRVQITATLANPSVGFKISTSGDAIDVDVVQNEAGTAATSPIVTTTATISRAADSLTHQTAGNIDFAVGTAFVGLSCQSSSYDGFPLACTVSGRIIYCVGSTQVRTYDGTTVVSQNSATHLNGGKSKIASSWSNVSSLLRLTANGSAISSGAFDGTMGSGAAINIGGENSAVSSAYIGPVAIYNYQMTDAELQAITA